MDIRELYQELIIDHGTHPRNCCQLPNANHCAEGYNPLCGDKVKVFINTDNTRITKACFIGSGCAISTASASLMTEVLAGKSTQEALELSQAFKHSLTTETEDTAPELGKLTALLGTKAFPARVKCATLPWHTLEAALKEEKKIVNTESLEDIPV